MKLWRRTAKKDADGKRNGRQIKYMAQMQEMMFKNQAQGYPLLDALLKRAGMTYVLTKKQQEALKGMIEKANEQTPEEPVDETK